MTLPAWNSHSASSAKQARPSAGPGASAASAPATPSAAPARASAAADSGSPPGGARPAARASSGGGGGQRAAARASGSAGAPARGWPATAFWYMLSNSRPNPAHRHGQQQSVHARRVVPGGAVAGARRRVLDAQRTARKRAASEAGCPRLTV